MPRQPQRCNIIHISKACQGRIVEFASRKASFIIMCTFSILRGIDLGTNRGLVCRIMPEIVPGIDVEEKHGARILMVRCPDFVRSSRDQSPISSGWPAC